MFAAVMHAPSAIHIRPALAADVPALERIVTAAYQKYIPRIGKPPGPMLDNYGQLVARNVVAIAENTSQPPGRFVMGFVVLLPAETYLLLDNIAVDPAHQGSGVGRVLMAFVEQEAHRLGLSELRLYTHEKMTENLAMYPAWGWTETERRTENGYNRVYFRKSLTIP